jgi:transporter family protein
MMGSLSWIGLGLIAALGGAGVAVLGKVGLGGIDATLATTIRSCVMTAVLLAVSAATGRFRGLGDPGVGLDVRAWTFIVLAGLSGAVSWLAYFGALRIGTAVQVASIDRLSLAFVIVFAALFLNERYGWRGWTGVALVVAGVLLVATDQRTVTPTGVGRAEAHSLGTAPTPTD